MKIFQNKESLRKESNVKLNGIVQKIKDLKKKKRALILAHVYQRGEVQDIADFTGDSLALSKMAVDTDAKVIVFCGVRFMAETAAILNPDKVVLMPRKDAGCPLADMAEVEDLLTQKKEYSGIPVVSYVNTSASIKASSDICCTSSNAVDVVNSLKEDKVLFVPDKNLGRFVASKTKKEVILWDGFCYVHHHHIKPEEIKRIKTIHPQAEIMAHPECQPQVIDLADFVGSTGQMAEYVAKNKSREFIVGTERGILHALQKKNPDKRFYSPSPLVVCQDMKLTKLENIFSSLENMQFQIRISEEIAIKAKKALDAMLKLGKKN
jgi:quinolinate synthase